MHTYIDVNRFSGTSRPNKEQGNLMCGKKVHQVSISDSVQGWNNNLVEWYIFGNRRSIFDTLRPFLPSETDAITINILLGFEAIKNLTSYERIVLLVICFLCDFFISFKFPSMFINENSKQPSRSEKLNSDLEMKNLGRK